MELPARFIEISRSYSRKITQETNPALNKYETEDFFASAKAECHADQAEDLSDRLFGFCRSEVYKAINGNRDIVEVEPGAPPIQASSPAQEPTSIDKYAVEVVGHTNTTDYPVAPELPRPPVAHLEPVQVSEPERLRAMVMGSVPGSTKKHLASFYVGWFGVEDSKQLPKDQGLYVEPLTALLKLVESKASHELLLSNPKEMGLDSRKHVSARAESEPIPVPEPPEPIKNQGEWGDVMTLDPLMVKMGWKNLETMAYAKALMSKYSHDAKKFHDHLHFLRLDQMPESDLLALFRLLFHTADGNALRQKQAHKNAPFMDGYAAVEKHLGSPVTMQSKTQDVIAAIQAAIRE